MTNLNDGILDGLKRPQPRTRGHAFDGEPVGAPMSFRVRGATVTGPPASGNWRARDTTLSADGGLWMCTSPGNPAAIGQGGTFVPVGPNMAPAHGHVPGPPRIVQALWMGAASGPFVIGGTHSAGSNADTSTYAVGTQSVYVTTNGSGAQAKISGNFASPLSLASPNQNLVIWMRQDSLASSLAGYPRIYLGDSGLTNVYWWHLSSGSTQPWNIDGEWMRVTLPFGTATIIGSPSRSSLATLTIQVYDNSAGTTTFHFGGIATMAQPATQFPNGVVSLSFDDGYSSVASNAAPLMDNYGYRGTAFLIGQILQGGGFGNYTNYLNVPQALALEAENGWECGTHAWNPNIHNVGYQAAGDAAALADAAAAKAFLTQQGFRSTHLHAYPLGTYDAGTILNTRALFGAARGIATLGGFPDETFPPANLTRLRSIALNNSSNMTTLGTWITEAAANNEWLILTMHDIQPSGAGSLQFTTANFSTMLADINSAGCMVLPIGEVLATAQ